MKVLLAPIALAITAAFTPTPVAAADDEAVEAFIRKTGCLRCHSVDRRKDAPAYRQIAGKYKGRPDAEQKLWTHLTTGPKVKIDGKEETHMNLKLKGVPDDQIRDVIAWVLSREPLP